MLEVQARATRQEKNKRHPDWKEEVKQSLFADDLTLYMESLKNTHSESMNHREGYKINIQKLIIFLCIAMNNLKDKLRKQSH